MTHFQEFSVAIGVVVLCMKQFLLDTILFVGDAQFHLSGNINSGDGRIWSAENPLRLSKICVCCTVCRELVV